MTAQPADDWQQNADVALMQSLRQERSEQPSTEEQYLITLHQTNEINSSLVTTNSKF